MLPGLRTGVAGVLSSPDSMPALRIVFKPRPRPAPGMSGGGKGGSPGGRGGAGQGGQRWGGDGGGRTVALAQLTGHRAGAVVGGHAGGTGQRHRADGADAAVVVQPFAAVAARLDVPDAIAELRRREAQHGVVGWLEDVTVGVDDGG